MKKYKYVLLDWDGNLARTLDVWLAALKVPLEKRGYSFSDEEIGANFTAFQERMEALGVKDVDVMVTEADEIATREAPKVELYPDALTTLEALRKADKKIALVTTSRHDQIDSLLAKYHLRELFEHVVCGDDVSRHKPHPEPIQKALSLLHPTEEEAIMVGDSSSDIIAAQNAGVDSILFFHTEHAKFYDIKKLIALKPTHTIKNFRDIVPLVEDN